MSRAHEALQCSQHEPSTASQLLLYCHAGGNFALFTLPDSDSDNIQIITDPSVISSYPSLIDEASCTSNCVERIKDDILHLNNPSRSYSDFTNMVALWTQDSIDAATGAQSVSLKCCLTGWTSTSKPQHIT